MKTILRGFAVWCVLLSAASPVSWETSARTAAPAVVTTVRVSLAIDQKEANFQCINAAISGDGSVVAFISYAYNLVSGDTNYADDIFVRELLSGTTQRISVRSNGLQVNFRSWGASVSADGRYVAFASAATNLVDGDTNALDD